MGLVGSGGGVHCFGFWWLVGRGVLGWRRPGAACEQSVYVN